MTDRALFLANGYGGKGVGATMSNIHELIHIRFMYIILSVEFPLSWYFYCKMVYLMYVQIFELVLPLLRLILQYIILLLCTDFLILIELISRYIFSFQKKIPYSRVKQRNKRFLKGIFNYFKIKYFFSLARFINRWLKR